MKKPLWILAALTITISCGTKKDTENKEVAEYLSARDSKLMRQVDSLETLIRVGADTIREENLIEASMYLTEAYQNFAYYYPQDSLSPMMLYKRGQLFHTVLRSPEKAGEIFDKLYADYPNYPHRGLVKFSSGDVWYEANDTAKAMAAFRMFLKDCPEHEMRKDAELRMKMIQQGKKAQDVIDELSKIRKQAS